MKSPLSAISTSRQLLRLASTLPSMISLSQEVISPGKGDLAAHRQLADLAVVAPRLGAGSPGRRIGSGGRIVLPARARSGARGGILRGPWPGRSGPAPTPAPTGRARLHRDAQIVRRICHFAVLCLGSLPAEHGWDTRSTLLKGWRHRRPGQGCGSSARQRLEDVQHEGRGNHRRDEIDERQGEQPRNHHPAQENAAGEPAAHPPGFPRIEPSERDHFEIPPPEKISVQHEKEKEIYPGNQQIDRKRQKIEQERQAGQPQRDASHLDESAAGGQSRATGSRPLRPRRRPVRGRSP